MNTVQRFETLRNACLSHYVGQGDFHLITPYQRLIGLGPPAAPLLLWQLGRPQPGRWVHALCSIFRTDVPRELHTGDYGSVRAESQEQRDALALFTYGTYLGYEQTDARTAGEDELKSATPDMVARYPCLARPEETAETTFHRLRLLWEGEVDTKTLTTRCYGNRHYQRIIGMGPAAVPFLLRWRIKGHGPAGWALAAVTAADPVPHGIDAWAAWAEAHRIQY